MAGEVVGVGDAVGRGVSDAEADGEGSGAAGAAAVWVGAGSGSPKVQALSPRTISVATERAAGMREDLTGAVLHNVRSRIPFAECARGSAGAPPRAAADCAEPSL